MSFLEFVNNKMACHINMSNVRPKGKLISTDLHFQFFNYRETFEFVYNILQ